MEFFKSSFKNRAKISLESLTSDGYIEFSQSLAEKMFEKSWKQAPDKIFFEETNYIGKLFKLLTF